MNALSRTITGIVAILLGIIILVFSFFTYFAIFYGFAILVIGIIILFNNKEDKIEEIKSDKKGGKK